MTSFTSIQDERLVSLVAANPTIYDTTLQAYKNLGTREKVWRDISKAMRCKTSEQCKRRWKHIRDAYNRCKRKNRERPGGYAAYSKAKKWWLFDRLKFIDEIPKERRYVQEESSENDAINEPEPGKSIVTKLENEEVNIEDVENAEYLTDEEDQESAAEDSKHQFEFANLPFQQEWNDDSRPDDSRTFRADESIEEIDEINYFTSYIGSILTKLTPSLRLEAKTKVFQLLAEYELKNLQQDGNV